MFICNRLVDAKRFCCSKKAEGQLRFHLARNKVLFEAAEKRVYDYLKMGNLPTWASSDFRVEQFTNKVRGMIASNGLPVPKSASTSQLFDATALVCASAMEDSGGNLDDQECFAAAMLHVIAKEKGKYWFN